MKRTDRAKDETHEIGSQGASSDVKSSAGVCETL